MKMKKLLTILLSMLLLIQPLTIYAQVEEDVAGEPFNDIKGHWAEDTIKKHYEMGMLEGYPDGTFKPDQKMKRAELIALINRYFGFKEESNTNFKDITGTEWYAEDAAKAKYYDYIEDLKLRPQEEATREDVIGMVSLIIDIEEQKAKKQSISFKDLDDLDKEDKEKIEKFAQMGYINGYDNNTFKPKEAINRAEIMTIVERTLGYIVRNQEDLDNMPKDTKKITIISPNIVIEDKEIKGDIYISQGVAGKITIKNTKITGQIEIAGGSKDNPVELENVEAEKVVITKSKETPKVEIKGNSKIDKLKTKSETEIEISGKTEIKEVNTKVKTQLKLKEKSEIKDLVTEGKTEVETSKDTTIEKLEAKSETDIKGKGKIKKAYIKDKDVEIEEKPEYTEVDKKVGQVDVGGKKVSSKNDDHHTSSGNSGGGNTSSSDNTSPTVSNKTLTADNATENSIDLSWTKATDDRTQASSLQYRVYYSKSNNLDTVQNIEANGVAVGDYRTDISSKTVTGLDPDTTYYFNVIVKDEKGNQSAYNFASSKTLIAAHKIYKIEDLASIGRTNPKTGEEWQLDDNYIIMNDLDFDSEDSYYDASRTDFGDINGDGSVQALNTELTTSTGWMPIAKTKDSQTIGFSGILNGDGHKISNLHIARTEDYQGLFRTLESGAVIEKLTLLQAKIKCGSISGMLAGAMNEARINQVSIVGIDKINKAEIETSSNKQYIGGLAGKAINSMVEQCEGKYIQIQTKESQEVIRYLGGLIGEQDGGCIKNCIARNININCTTAQLSGGMIGQLTNNHETIATIMENCTSKDLNIAAGNGSTIGGMIGNVSSVDNKAGFEIKNSTASGTVIGAESVGGFVGYIDGRKLKTVKILIKDCSANVDVSYISKAKSYGGFVGILFNVDLRNCFATGSVKGGQNVGGFVGYLDNSTVTGCYATGEVNGDSGAGGFAGTIAKSSTVTDCYALGDVTGQYVLGGFVGGGEENSQINRCYCIGTVEGQAFIAGLAGNHSDSTIENCIAFNKNVKEGNKGYSNRVTNGENGLTNNFAYQYMTVKENGRIKTGTSDPTSIWGGDLETLSDLENLPLSNWDFKNVWEIKDGAGRPTLRNVGNDDGVFTLPEIDKTVPTIDNKTLTANNATENSIDISWTKAKDDTSNEDKLQYRVYYSETNNLDTVENIEDNGTAVGEYEVKIANKKVTGLETGKTYYFNVIVKDEIGNKSAYTAVSGSTLAINNIAVKTNPKTTYKDGDRLDLTGLVVTLTKSDDTNEDVPFTKFEEKGITTSPVNNTVLNTSDTVVTITIGNISTELNITVQLFEMLGSGTEADPFIVESIEDLVAVGRGISVDNQKYYTMNKYYKLGRDLNFTDTNSYQNPEGKDEFDVDNDGRVKDETLMAALTQKGGRGFEPIEGFQGTFDGNGHTITNLYINRSTNSDFIIGLFGRIQNSATISNLGMENVSVKGFVYVGGIAGRNHGTIKNSYIKGEVTGIESVGGLVGENFGSILENSHAEVTVTGGSYAGGLAGGNGKDGIIKNCYTEGIVTIPDSQKSSNRIGGLVGPNDGTIKNCYAKATVKGKAYVGGLAGSNSSDATIENSYAIGKVTGEGEVGGLTGDNDGTIENSYAAGTVEGNSIGIGGLIGDITTDGARVVNSIAFNSNVSGNQNVGRVIGYIRTGTACKDSHNYANNSMEMNIESDFVDGKISNGTDITAEDFKTNSFYTNDSNWDTNDENSIWDFTSTWVIQDGADRPTLKNVGNDNGKLTIEVIPAFNSMANVKALSLEAASPLDTLPQADEEARDTSEEDITSIDKETEEVKEEQSTEDKELQPKDDTIDKEEVETIEAEDKIIEDKTEDEVEVEEKVLVEDTEAQDLEDTTSIDEETEEEVKEEHLTEDKQLTPKVDEVDKEELETTEEVKTEDADEAKEKSLEEDIKAPDLEYTTDADKEIKEGEEVEEEAKASNNNPEAVDDTVKLYMNESIVIDVLKNDTDTDEDKLMIEEYSQGEHGSVTQEGNTLIYTPEEGYLGEDSFTYTINDGKEGIATGTVNITVNELDADNN